jgi:hypothetical protein
MERRMAEYAAKNGNAQKISASMLIELIKYSCFPYPSFFLLYRVFLDKTVFFFPIYD